MLLQTFKICCKCAKQRQTYVWFADHSCCFIRATAVSIPRSVYTFIERILQTSAPNLVKQNVAPISSTELQLIAGSYSTSTDRSVNSQWENSGLSQKFCSRYLLQFYFWVWQCKNLTCKCLFLVVPLCLPVISMNSILVYDNMLLIQRSSVSIVRYAMGCNWSGIILEINITSRNSLPHPSPVGDVMKVMVETTSHCLIPSILSLNHPPSLCPTLTAALEDLCMLWNFKILR